MGEAMVPGSQTAQERFHWSFDGRVVALDNGAGLATKEGFTTWMELETFAVVSFDPAGLLEDRDELMKLTEFQHVPNSTLGDGQPVTFHACLDNVLSSTLEPLPESLVEASTDKNLDLDPILARLPMASIRLDDIEGLSGLDWLVLDALNDNAAILENGVNTLADALLVEVQIPFVPTHVGQAGFGAIQQRLGASGLRFCRFQNFRMHSGFPAALYLEKNQSSEMRSATTLFLPTDERLASLPNNQLLKLSFLLHTVYKLHDLTYQVLHHADAELAKQYLVAEGYLWPVDRDETRFTLTDTYSPDIWAQ